MDNNTINFIVADDHRLFAEGIEQIILNYRLGIIVEKVQNGKQLFKVLDPNKHHFIILDINMPEMDGIEALNRIRKEYGKIKVLIVSMHEDHGLVKEVKSKGADGFLPKSLNAIDLKEAIESIWHGNTYFSVLENRTVQKDDTMIFTPREWEIVHLIVQGHTTRQISEQLDLSTYTIDTHRKNIGRKSNTHSAVNLAKYVEKLKGKY